MRSGSADRKIVGIAPIQAAPHAGLESSMSALILAVYDSEDMAEHVLGVRPGALLRATLSLEQDAEPVQELGGFPSTPAEGENHAERTT
jgi:hypothetical protein